MLGVACCSGYLDEGTPAGSFVELGGVRTYLAVPKDWRGGPAVILAHDAFGVGLVNSQLICDALAARGLLAAMPDLFDGTGIDPQVLDALDSWRQMGLVRRAGFVLWMLGPQGALVFMLRHRAVIRKMPTVRKVMADLRSRHGATAIGIQGYCYGGKVGVLMAGNADGRDGEGADAGVGAVVVAHPSLLSVPSDIEAIRRPVLFCCAEEDFAFNESARHKTERILARKAEESGLRFGVRVFPGTTHGFAVRGGPSTREAREAALEAGVAFFREVLGGAAPGAGAAAEGAAAEGAATAGSWAAGGAAMPAAAAPEEARPAAEHAS